MLPDRASTCDFLAGPYHLDYVLAGTNFYSALPSTTDFADVRAMVPSPVPLLYEVTSFESSGNSTLGTD